MVELSFQLSPGGQTVVPSTLGWAFSRSAIGEMTQVIFRSGPPAYSLVRVRRARLGCHIRTWPGAPRRV